MRPDGKCKAFASSANGYVRGEGVGAVLLKPLKKAEADGDHIYAVIKGSAENHCRAVFNREFFQAVVPGRQNIFV